MFLSVTTGGWWNCTESILLADSHQVLIQVEALAGWCVYSPSRDPQAGGAWPHC